jgi:hypothetical protein
MHDLLNTYYALEIQKKQKQIQALLSWGLDSSKEI